MNYLCRLVIGDVLERNEAEARHALVAGHPLVVFDSKVVAVTTHRPAIDLSEGVVPALVRWCGGGAREWRGEAVRVE